MTVVRSALIASTLAFILAPAPRALAQMVHNDGQVSPDSLIQAARDASRPFLDVNNTSDGQYFPVLGCVSGQQDGAMGVHYLNGGFLMDHGVVREDQPEALLYEFRNGKATLTAVEYIVLAEDWDPDHPMTPPALLGQLFTYTPFPNRFGLKAFYSLHVWAWKNNPSGTFVDWNPTVSCDDAPTH
jgi:hypothetical protein